MKLIVPHPGHFSALEEICKEAPKEAEIYMVRLKCLEAGGLPYVRR